MTFKPVQKLNITRTLSTGAQITLGTLAQNRQGVFFQYDAGYIIDVLPDLKDGDSSHERLTSQTENVRGRVNIAVLDCTAIHALPLSYA